MATVSCFIDGFAAKLSCDTVACSGSSHIDPKGMAFIMLYSDAASTPISPVIRDVDWNRRLIGFSGILT